MDIWFLNVSKWFFCFCTSLHFFYLMILQSSTIFAVSYDVLSRLQCNSQRALSRRQSPGSSEDEVPKQEKSKHIEIEKSHRNIDNSIIIQWNHVESKDSPVMVVIDDGIIQNPEVALQVWGWSSIGMKQRCPRIQVGEWLMITGKVEEQASICARCAIMLWDVSGQISSCEGPWFISCPTLCRSLGFQRMR